MTGLSKVIVLMALIFSVVAQDINEKTISAFIDTELNQFINTLCGSPWISQTDLCKTTPAPQHPSTTQATTPSTVQTSSSSASPLQNAHWCYLANGTYLSLGYTYMSTPCILCQCTQTRNILCTKLRCMNTYCIDDSTPSVRDGQCCAQCAYEKHPDSCLLNGIAFPHGAVVRNITGNVVCWCQAGNIECRTVESSAFASLDLWGTGTAVYVVVVIILIVLFVGILLCCSCTLFYYYYYKNNHAAQEAFDQYFSNGGWQPMNEDGVIVDTNAEQKQAEAENSQYENNNPTGNSEAYIPPPYALYNDSFVNDQHKDEKYT